MLVRAGRRGPKVVEAAKRWIEAAGGLALLLDGESRPWRRFGLSDAVAAALAACHELTCRQLRRRLSDRPLECPGDIADYVLARYGIADQEVLGALFLDAHLHLLSEQEIFRGTLRRADAEPRQILRRALHLQARSLLVWHTHPSGNPTPSGRDLDFTRRLRTAADAVGLDLLDHLVVGHGGSWASIGRRRW